MGPHYCFSTHSSIVWLRRSDKKDPSLVLREEPILCWGQEHRANAMQSGRPGIQVWFTLDLLCDLGQVMNPSEPGSLVCKMKIMLTPTS